MLRNRDIFDELFNSMCSYPVFEKGRYGLEYQYHETDKEYKIEIELPRYKRDEISIEWQDGVLHIEAQRKSDDKEYKFEKAYSFDNEVDFEKISAEISDGVLYVVVPKLIVKKKTHKIEIK